MSAKHTPGPWRWWTSNSFFRLSSDATGKDGDVLSAFTGSDGMACINVSNANAALIAAAPDLAHAAAQALACRVDRGGLCASCRDRLASALTAAGVP